MESYIAIIISIITFVFTVYQWLIAMNSRRPRLKAVAFRPERISFCKKLNFLRIYMPEKWHIVNFSDIPNSVMSIKIFAKINRNWLAGEFNNSYKLKQLFPALITSHTYITFTDEPLSSGKTCYFQFDRCPTDEELANLSVKIELEDQYDMVHRQILSAKDIRKEKVEKFPGLSGLYADNEHAKILLELKSQIDDDNIAIYVVYHSKSDRKDFPHLVVSRYSKYTAAPWLGSDFNVSQEQLSWKDSEQDKVQIDDWNEEKRKVYLLLENKIPKAIELEVADMGQQINKRIDLPQQLIESLQAQN